MNVIFENDDFVICEITEIVPIYEGDEYIPSYLDIIHISDTKKIDNNKMYIHYYFKQTKLQKTQKHIEPLNVVSVPMKWGGRDSKLMWDKINEIIEYINK